MPLPRQEESSPKQSNTARRRVGRGEIARNLHHDVQLVRFL